MGSRVGAQDQKEHLAQCKAQLDALLEERGGAEQAFTDAYAASLAVYEEQLDAAHSADQDAYHALRTRWACPNGSHAAGFG